MVRDKMNKNRKRQANTDEDNGFAAWGGYMEAKKSKLIEQYTANTVNQTEKVNDIFKGIAIFVNGLTNPGADELKKLMAQHGGIYHTYQTSKTTHIIASNLPNIKILKQSGAIPVVKPTWITDSISFSKLLDYKRYLLYTNQNSTQPRLDFPVVQMNNVAKTASDPNFLQEFYGNSRLHLIATLGAEYKQLVAQLREKSNGLFPGREKLASIKNESEILNNITESIIMHIDMDCFFVSVGLRSRPDLIGKPVAVTHARNAQNVPTNPMRDRKLEFELYVKRLAGDGRDISKIEEIDEKSSMSEIASCSYEARKCGVKNGMFLGAAIKICPDLIPIPYDFEGYKQVSNILYHTIASYTLDIEAVSCDEMYVDVTKILKQYNLSVESFASCIRNEIMQLTGCPCSTGFGTNRLQARLATKRAKPSGQFHLKPNLVESYMFDMPLSDLPGVGGATLVKLSKLGLKTCGNVQMASLKLLQNELGPKSGETVYWQAKGVDRKPLNFDHERKSVSAEVNYGIRFKSLLECYNFLEKLAGEVANRLNELKMKAKNLTLKVLVRAADAPIETAKFLGHGICDSFSKSHTFPTATSNVELISKESKILYEKLNLEFGELRGVGLQLGKLERLAQAQINKTLSTFLQQSSETIKKSRSTTFDMKTTEILLDKTKNNNISSLKNNSDKSNHLLQMYLKNDVKNNYTKLDNEIDLNVLNELPEELRIEIIKEYQIDLNKKNIENKNIDKVETCQNPFENLTLEELKRAIKSWIATCSDNEPSIVDVSLLGEHLKRLAIDRQIENLHIIFNFMHRNMANLNCRWHDAYISIANLTQEGMVARYGNILLINRDFNCELRPSQK